ncbi:MAG: c-type cytochrome [Hydrogenimonas sp.]|nr:c-type cytochrome [Hydrogenimonas sp.]
MKKVTLALMLAGAASLVMADGAALYKKCAGCHGAKGEKKALGKSAVIGGMDVATLVNDLKEYKAGKRNVHGMGMMMKSQVQSLSDADIQAVAEYIHGLK